MPGSRQFRTAASNKAAQAPAETARAAGSPSVGPVRRRYQPAIEGLESRQLLSAVVQYQETYSPAPSDYYAQPIPIATPGASHSSSIWANAHFYQYGADPTQQLWVLIPPEPTGKLDLIVHGGGFRQGRLTAADPLAQFDMSEGTTVVSVGYRLLADWLWPAPVDDITRGLDEGYQLAQSLTGDRITDVTETGLSAGGTGLALINYSPAYPSTTFQPNRIITISAPLVTGASSPAPPSFGFRYTSVLKWGGVTPKTRTPITLMGTPGDPVAIERDGISDIGEFANYLRRSHIEYETYLDPHDPGHHGSVSWDVMLYPDVGGAVEAAQSFKG